MYPNMKILNTPLKFSLPRDISYLYPIDNAESETEVPC